MSGYQRLDQEDRGDSVDPDIWRLDRANSLPADARGRARTNSTIDIKAINARLERWADEITSKFTFRNRRGQDEPAREVYHSVFICPSGYEPQQVELEEEHGTSVLQFDDIVDAVRYAISQGVHPLMIRQGSSGSYFARDNDGRIVAVFKPKNEEPYGKLNPKWTKWLHRNLFPCFFGRSCLIPNLSYISEAAAFLLDKRLQTFLVPYTDIIWMSSKSFHYDFWDRRSYYRKGKPLPPKIGSFQVFLEGYQDANLFLKDHPWPEGPVTRYSKNSRRGKRWVNRLLDNSQTDEGDEDEDLGEQSNAARANDVNTQPQKFAWTGTLQQAFREELEKLVILDYIMRNTDRGLDNWMVKVSWDKERGESKAETPGEFKVLKGEPELNSSILHTQPVYQQQQPMIPSRPSSSTPANFQLSLGAIDNSLAFPWKHPDQWRSFPFGWLFLPVGIIGQPFSAKTRDHFLPILTSTKWWNTTISQLRELFCQDSDFQERMFARQMAVLKGQAWNVVETLKQQDQGPLELTRRPRMEVPVAVPLSNNVASRAQSREPDEEADISSMASSAPMRDQFPRRTISPDQYADPRNPSMLRSVSFQAAANLHKVPEHSLLDDEENHISGLQDIWPHQEHKRKSETPNRGYRRRGLSVGASRSPDEERDIGFLAAEDTDASRKKVIIERLETVQSEPVFSWF